jgi:outer membrane protein insertion porin family
VRRILHALAIVLAVFAAIFLVAWIVVSSSWTENRARLLLVEQLRKELGGEVEIEDLSLRLVRAEARVQGLALRGGSGLVGELALREGTVRLSRRALLGGLVRPVRIEADGLAVTLAETPPDDAPDEPLDLSIFSRLRRLRVADGSFRFRGREQRFAVDVDGIGLDGQPERGGSRGTLTAGPARFERPGAAPLLLDRLRGEFAWHSPRLTLENVTLEAPGASLSGSGSLAFLPTGLAARADARGSAALEDWLGAEVPDLSGRIAFEGGFRLDEDGSWTGQGRLSNDGAVRFRRAEIVRLEASLVAGPDGVRVVDGRAASAAGTTVDRLAVAIRGGAIEAEAGGRLVATDVFPNLGLEPDLVAASGAYRARLWRTREGEPLRWSVEAEPVPDPARPNGLDGRFTGEGGGGRIALDFGGAWGGSKLTFRLRGDDAVVRDGLTIEAGLDAPGAAAARAAFAHLLEQGRRIDLELPLETTPVPDGPMRVAATVRLVDGKLTGLAATVDVDGLYLGRSRFESYHGQFDETARDRWELAMHATDATGGRVEATLEIPPGPGFTLDARATEADYDAVSEVVRALGIELELPEGRGLVSGTIAGDWSAAAARLEFDAATELTLGDATPVTAAARGTLTNDAVRLDDGTLRLPGLEAAFSGDVALPDGPRPLQARLRSRVRAELAPLFGWLELGEASGIVEGDLAGTFESFDRPLPLEGTVSWRELAVSGLRIPAGAAAVTAEDDGFRLDSTAGRLEHRLAISGPIGNPSFELTTHSDGMPVQDLAASELGAGSAVQAEGRGTLHAAGVLREQPTWHGRLDLEGLSLTAATIEAHLARPARIDLEPGGRLTLVTPVELVTARDSRMKIEGEYGLWGRAEGQLGLVVTGSLDLAVLELYASDVISSGTVSATLKVSGTLEHPELFGAMQITGGRVLYVPFAQVIDGIEGEVLYDGEEATIRSLTGHSGGGTIALEGRAALSGLAVERIDLRATVDNVAVAYPRGFLGRYDADATVTGTLEGAQVRGIVTVLSGRYAQDFQLVGGALGRSRKVQPKASAASWMQRIGLSLDVVAEDSLSVRNELARVDASARLVVRGTLAGPLLVGNVTLLEGGEITFRDVDYDLLSGQVTMDDVRAAPVRVRAVAETEVSGYQVRIDLDATTETVEYTLTSTPALSRADILSLLLTGRTNRESGGASSASLESQGAAYFGTALSEMLLSGTAKKYLGLNRFSISPVEASPGSEPTARLTVGKRLDEKTNVLYSRDLAGETSDVYSIEREIAPRTKIVAGQNDKGGVGASVRWTYRFGASDDGRGALQAPDRLGDVEITGLPEGMNVSRRKIGVSRGTPLSRSTLIQAAEGLKLALVERGYLQATVVPRTVKAPGAARASIQLEATPGPLWEVRIKGAGGSERTVRRALDEFWALVDFRSGLHRQTESLVRERLAEEGYAAATVSITDGAGDPPWVAVSVDPGARVRVAEVKVAGNQALPDAEVLKQILSRPGWRPGDKPTYRPREVEEDAEAIRTLYATEGYLDAVVAPRVRFRTDGEEVLVTYRIEEGQRARIGAVRIDGDWPAALGRASDRIPFRTGDNFKPQKVEQTERTLRAALDDAGYYDSAVSMLLQSGDGKVDVTYRVQAGRPYTIASVAFSGLEKTREKVVRQAVTLQAGQPLTRAAVQETERNLFALGLFREIEVRTTPVPDQPERQAVVIELKEAPTTSLTLSGGWDTETQFAAAVGLSHDNLWGIGRTGGIQAYYSSILSGVRATLEDRRLRRGTLEGLVTAGWEEEVYPGFTSDTTSAAVQLAVPELRNKRWLVRYQLEDTRIVESALSTNESFNALLDEQIQPVRLGSLGFAGQYDRRDDPFLPTRGWVVRGDVGLFSTWLASQEEFWRVQGQIGGYWPVGNRLTFASAVRVGFAPPYGETACVPLQKRFFTGGFDSVRGFPRDGLNPVVENEASVQCWTDDAGTIVIPVGSPLEVGGESMFVFNLEARYRVWGEAEVVLFTDRGNVWLTIPEWDPFDTRNTLGLGFRYRTPIGALRAEYGWKLDRQPGESGGQFYFAIGDVF